MKKQMRCGFSFFLRSGSLLPVRFVNEERSMEPLPGEASDGGVTPPPVEANNDAKARGTDLVQGKLDRLHQDNPDALRTAWTNLCSRVRAAVAGTKGRGSVEYSVIGDLIDQLSKGDTIKQSGGFNDAVKNVLASAMGATGLSSQIDWYGSEKSIAGKDWNKPEWRALFVEAEREARKQIDSHANQRAASALLPGAAPPLDDEGIKRADKTFDKKFLGNAVSAASAIPARRPERTDVRTESRTYAARLKITNEHIGDFDEKKILYHILNALLKNEGGLNADFSEAKPDEIVEATIAAQKKVISDLPKFGADGIVGEETIVAWRKNFPKYFEVKPIAAAPTAPPALATAQIVPTVASEAVPPPAAPVIASVPAAVPVSPAAPNVLDAQSALAETPPKLEVVKFGSAVGLPIFERKNFFTVKDNHGALADGEVVYAVRKEDAAGNVLTVARKDGTEIKVNAEFLKLCDDEDKQRLYRAERYEILKKSSSETLAVYLPAIRRETIYMYNGQPVELLNYTPEGVAYILRSADLADAKPTTVNIGIKPDGKPDLLNADLQQQASYIIARYDACKQGLHQNDIVAQGKLASKEELTAGKDAFKKAPTKATVKNDFADVVFVSPRTGMEMPYMSGVPEANQKKGSEVAITGETPDGKSYAIITSGGLAGFMPKDALSIKSLVPSATDNTVAMGGGRGQTLTS